MVATRRDHDVIGLHARKEILLAQAAINVAFLVCNPWNWTRASDDKG